MLIIPKDREGIRIRVNSKVDSRYIYLYNYLKAPGVRGLGEPKRHLPSCVFPSVTKDSFIVLKQRLLQLLSGSVSQPELTELVHIARSIVQAHLDTVRSSTARLCLQQGLTSTDLAYDCIADAFARDGNGMFPRVQDFARALSGELSTLPEREVFLAFRAFLGKLSAAQLARLYSQNDPPGAKIHRNIRDYVKKSDFFDLRHDYRGMMLAPKGEDLRELSAPFPIDLIEREMLNHLDHRETTGQQLQLLHSVLTDQSTYCRAVPLIDVVRIFKKIYASDAAMDEPLSRHGLEELSDFDISAIRLQVEAILKEKIVLTYLARGKVTRAEAEAMFLAMQDQFEDWIMTQDSESSMYKRVKKQLDISEHQYEATLRTKMEYLLKMAREEFGSRLMKDL